MHKKSLCLAIAGALLTVAVAGHAEAAPKLKRAPAPAPAVKADHARFGDRIVVRYNHADRAAQQRAVGNAASRANVSTVTATGARVPALSAIRVRQLGTGAALLRLSRKLSTTELQKLVTELSADPTVKYAQVDRLVQPVDGTDARRVSAARAVAAAAPNDEFFAEYQWNFNNAVGGIGAEAAWTRSKGVGIVVANIDTGIVAHPDLDANMLPGYDFITDAFISRRPTNERVPGAADLGDWTLQGECGSGSPAKDSSWHGSHTAGTIAEVSFNGIGAVGLAHKAKVLPIRALGRCGGYNSDIADAIVWASGGHVDGVPDNLNAAEVINMSLGGSGSCDAMTQEAINSAVSRGTTIVVAAGNSNANAGLFSPASCENVITVAATGITGARAPYSNYGARVDLAAPGGAGDAVPEGFVLQAGNSSAKAPDLNPATGNTYWFQAGTSMASPHVAATVALVQAGLASQARTPLTPAAMESLLKQTSRNFPVVIPGNTPIGAGIVDPKAALDTALLPPCVPTAEVPCGPPVVVLTNKVEVRNVNSAQGDRVYTFTAAAGKPLTVLSLAGMGDASLYVRYGQAPTSTVYDARSTRAGSNTESVRIAAPRAGTYYIVLTGNYSGMTLSARQ